MEIYNGILTDTFVSIRFDDEHVQAYVNSARGRNNLINDCTTEIVESVFQTWGDNATVTDPTLSFEPTNKLSDLDVVGMQLVETLLQSG